MDLEFWQLPTPVSSAVGTPSSMLLSNGNVLVLWSQNGSPGASFAIYDQLGTAVAGGTINPDAAGAQFAYTMLPDENGAFTLLYGQYTGTGYALYIQHFNSAAEPIGDAITVDSDYAVGSNGAAQMVELPDGGYAVVYNNFGDGYDIEMRMVDGSGAVSDVITVMTTGAGRQFEPHIASNGTNLFVTWWDETTQDVRGQMMSLAGTPIGSEFLVQSSVTGDHSRPQIDVFSNGNYIVVWDAYNAPGADADSGSARGRLFDASGVPLGAEFVLNENTAGYQGTPDVTVLPDDSFMISYWGQNDTGGFRWFNSDGSARTGTLESNMPLSQVSLVAMGDGRMAAFGTDSSLYFSIIDGRMGQYNGDNGDNILVSRRTGDTTIYGFGGNDRFYGNNDNDTFYGGGGNDEFRSQLGQDFLYGGAGNDTYYLTAFSNSQQYLTTIVEYASEGFDTVHVYGPYTLAANIEAAYLYEESGVGSLTGNTLDNVLGGNSADNTLDGGAGNDIASYIGASTGVTVSLILAGAAQNTFGAGNDTLISIEGLHGSQFGDWLTGNDAANTLAGLGGDDMLEGRGGNDIIDGGAGRDFASYASASAGVTVSLLIAGTSQNTVGAGLDTLISIENLWGSSFTDSFTASNGGSYLAGNGGNDILRGGAGNDRLDGGTGTDLASYVLATAGVTVSLATQNAEQNTVGAGLDWLSGIENLDGSNLADQLTGNDFANTISGLAGDDVLFGGGGADVLNGGANSDTLSGDAGDDSLRGNDGIDSLYGGAGWDTLDGGAGNDLIDGGNGNDTVSYASASAGVTVSLALQGVAQNTLGAGTDRLVAVEYLSGSAFADVLTGNALDNLLTGLDGDDTIRGGGGIDTIAGNAGSDTLDGQDGSDVIYGGDGDDALLGGTGWDRLLGDGGNDTLDGGNGSDYLFGGEGNDTVRAGIGNDLAYGQQGDDTLYGEAGNDRMQGDAGNDVLDGGADNDVLLGGNGQDVLIGGDGADVLRGQWERDELTGGAGADTFIIGPGETTRWFESADVITDFATGEDRIDLSAMDANSSVAGNDAFAFIGNAAFSGTAGELRFSSNGVHTLIEGDINGDSVVDILIILNGDVALTGSDFIL